MIISSSLHVYMCHPRTLGCNQPIKMQNSTSSIKIMKHLQEDQNKRKTSSCNQSKIIITDQDQGRTPRCNHSIRNHQDPRASATKPKGNKSQLHYAPITITQKSQSQVTITNVHSARHLRIGYSSTFHLPDT